MQLSLLHNDPTQTLLVTPDGVSLYEIETPSLPHGRTTTIKRLERDASSGHVESEVGRVEYHELHGTRLSLCAADLDLVLLPVEAGVLDNSWAFIGPDNRPYKWQVFIHYPVLILNDNSQTPIARYRRAKLGLISRSRRAFIEIFPAGLGILDLVVVTFVSFMKQRMTIETHDSSG